MSRNQAPVRDDADKAKAPPEAGPSNELRSACLAVLGVLAAVGAELVHREPVGVVTTVLDGDVVAVLAHLTRQGDLRTYVGGCHRCCLSIDRDVRSEGRT